MPLLQPNDEIFLISRGVSVKGKLLNETSNRMLIQLQKEIPTSPFSSAGFISAEVRHGSYRNTFQSKIIYFDQDLHTKMHLLIIDYPATFKRERVK
ncbi:MAG: hypothetical protein H3C43_14260 [Leptonema sp. (in: Bacteria)]|nr:hypothetical protein [Leptonema sp. (in: bacteria)]